MTYKTIFVYLWSSLLIYDFFNNRNKKQIEIISLSYEMVLPFFPLYFFLDERLSLWHMLLRIAIIFVISYLLKVYLIGIRMFYDNIEQQEIIDIIQTEYRERLIGNPTEEANIIKLEDNIDIYCRDKYIVVKSGFDLIKGYRMTRDLGEKLADIDERNNNSLIFLLYGIIVLLFLTVL